MADAAITEVATVFVLVSDADRTLAFYTGVLGFEKRANFGHGDGGRWVEISPPGTANGIAIVATQSHPGGRDRTICAPPTDPIGRKGTERAGLILTELTISGPIPPQFLFRARRQLLLVVEPEPSNIAD
jgi:hypothetical protein